MIINEIPKPTLCLESSEENWEAEQSGDKSNTIRIRTVEEVTKECIAVEGHKLFVNGLHIPYIEITEIGTGRYFKRELTDVSVYKNIMIFSWSSQDV
jgi:hypothetical protein